MFFNLFILFENEDQTFRLAIALYMDIPKMDENKMYLKPVCSMTRILGEDRIKKDRASEEHSFYYPKTFTVHPYVRVCHSGFLAFSTSLSLSLQRLSNIPTTLLTHKNTYVDASASTLSHYIGSVNNEDSKYLFYNIKLSKFIDYVA